MNLPRSAFSAALSGHPCAARIVDKSVPFGTGFSPSTLLLGLFCGTTASGCLTSIMKSVAARTGRPISDMGLSGRSSS